MTVVHHLDGKLRYCVWYGAKLALPVQKWPQNGLSAPKPPIFAPQCASPMCWRHTMLPWMTLGLGWGCISSGKGPSSGLRGNSKSDAGLDSLSIICVSFTYNCCTKKRNVLSRNWRQTTKVQSKLSCTVAPSLYGWDRTFQTERTSTVLYGANTVWTV